jgi:hypothetical protein
MRYNVLPIPVINPRNGGEILNAAINKVYRLSGGNLRNFLPGSPLMVLLESLIFAHLELLHWAENVPDAMVLTMMGKLLGAGIGIGTRCTATVEVTLTAPLLSTFFIPKNTQLINSADLQLVWQTSEDLFINPGGVTGSVNCAAENLGSEYYLAPGQIAGFAQNFAFVSSVTNLSASTTGEDPEDTLSAQNRIKALLSQRNPSSPEDWGNIIESFFGTQTKYSVKKNTPNLDIYIKDYVAASPSALAFEAEIQRQRTLLQEVFVKNFDSIGVELSIRYTSSTPLAPEAISITEGLNSFIENFRGAPQLVDLYSEFVQLTGNDNLAGFELKTYSLGVRLWRKTLEFYDWNSGQLVKDSSGNYFLGSSNTHVVGSAFDEAELGLLTYYPVLENFAGGYVDAGYIVGTGGLYYLVTTNGNFVAGVPLPASSAWAFATSYTAGSFILEPSASSLLSHGFIVNASYNSSPDWGLTLSAIAPSSKALGNTVAANEVWFLNSKPEIIYRAVASATITNSYIQSITPEVIAKYPIAKEINHWLTHHSQYRIGTVSTDLNYITIDSNGNKLPLPPGLSVDFLSAGTSTYGTLFFENGEIYEFTTGALPIPGNNASTLPTKKATRNSANFEFISYPGETPYFLKISKVEFLRGFSNDPEKTVIEVTPGNYAII